MRRAASAISTVRDAAPTRFQPRTEVQPRVGELLTAGFGALPSPGTWASAVRSGTSIRQAQRPESSPASLLVGTFGVRARSLC
jgi:hypothetical protein